MNDKTKLEIIKMAEKVHLTLRSEGYSELDTYLIAEIISAAAQGVMIATTIQEMQGGESK